jgi:UDPglucose--hexose-1-phosphate uridylyltransferase
MSEIRENRLTGEWVIIAPGRAKRGGHVGQSSPRAEIPAYSADCPFCPGNEAQVSEERYRAHGDDHQWAVRSVANKFSLISATGEVAPSACEGGAGRLGDCVNAVGLHEVLIEGPRHDLDMAQLPTAHVRQILEAYRTRFQAFYADSRIRHVIVFKNHGLEAGASQQHPHSQIVGLPIVPGQIVDRMERARRFFADTGRCLACAMIEQEREQRCRIVAENADFIAFIPYAALSQYHLWIFPKTHAPCFSEQPIETIQNLAEILRTILAKLHGLLENPPFNLVVRSLGPQDKGASHFHWYISIVPRVTHTAGFELGTGMYINPSAPEDSAGALRDYPG